MGSALLLLAAVILMAILFDFVNGFHDAANAISTVVSTGVLPIRTAVLMAAALNFGGALYGTAVAKTIATGFADPTLVTQTVVLAALTGAIIWNLLTWWWGLPSSSSHALIGGLAGAVVAHAGWKAFRWGALKQKVLLPLVLSPTIGFVAAFVLMIGVLWLIHLLRVRPATVNRTSRITQLFSSLLMAFSHGSNDAQKSMGIITLALLAFASGGFALPFGLAAPVGGSIPTWVVIACAAAIAAGTAAGGKKIIKTMGTKIFRISPLEGSVAETAGALTILGAAHLGVPVSTTHCVNACLMGVGSTKRISAVRWGVAGSILLAWILTLPAGFAASYVVMKLLALFL